MTVAEVTDRQRKIIKEQADIIVELSGMVEQARLTGPGVEAIFARCRQVEKDIGSIAAESGNLFSDGQEQEHEGGVSLWDAAGGKEGRV